MLSIDAGPASALRVSTAQVVVTLVFPDLESDGAAGTLTCWTSNDRVSADTLLFPTEAEAMDVYAHVCGAR
jgi:hypothetical protein